MQWYWRSVMTSHPTTPGGGGGEGGGTPLYGLYDVPLDRVWFLASVPWTGYNSFRRVCPKQALNMICPKQAQVRRLTSLNIVCPNQRPKIEGDVLLRVLRNPYTQTLVHYPPFPTGLAAHPWIKWTGTTGGNVPPSPLHFWNNEHCPYNGQLRWFLSIALRILTAHDFLRH